MKIIRVMVLCCVALLGSVAVYAKDAPIQYKIQRQRPGLLRVAMAVHPEYDDQYFRYIENSPHPTRAAGRMRV